MATNLFNMYGSGPPNRGRLGSLLEEEEKKKRIIQAWLDSRGAAAPVSGEGIEPHGLTDPTIISEEEYNEGMNPAYIYDKTTVPEYEDRRISVNPHGDMGIAPKYETTPTTANPGTPYASPGAPIQGEGTPGQGDAVPKVTRTGYTPTPGTVQPRSDAPSGEKVKTGTHDDYTKTLDTSFLAAMLQSAIPEKQEDSRTFRASGGAHGGGPIPEMTQFLSAERRKKENPSLWRYS
jgi:hypothetical protein